MRWLIGTFALAGTIAVIAGTLPQTGEALSPDEALLSLFPVDSGGVIFLDAAELRNQPVVREYFLDESDIQLPAAVVEFARRTGLDPETDVDQVMLGRTGENEFLGVARANFDPIEVEQYFLDSDIGFESYSGRTIYQPSPGSGWSVSFIDGIVLMGEDGSVRGAIDRMAVTGQTAMDNPELTQAIQSIEEGNQVWGVGMLTDMLFPEALVPPMAVDLIASLERVTYQMQLDTGLRVRAVGEFTSPDTARRTGDLLRGVVALGKMQVFEREELIQLLDGLQIDSVESSIEIRFSADGELLRRVTESGFQLPRLGD
jgi:hypothetical protein